MPLIDTSVSFSGSTGAGTNAGPLAAIVSLAIDCIYIGRYTYIHTFVCTPPTIGGRSSRRRSSTATNRHSLRCEASPTAIRGVLVRASIGRVYGLSDVDVAKQTDRSVCVRAVGTGRHGVID